MTYEGGRWHRIAVGEVPATVLVRHGAVIPRVEFAQSTDRIDWSEIELAVFGAGVSAAEGLVCLPAAGELHPVRLKRDGGAFALEGDPLQGMVAFRVVRPAQTRALDPTHRRVSIGLDESAAPTHERPREPVGEVVGLPAEEVLGVEAPVYVYYEPHRSPYESTIATKRLQLSEEGFEQRRGERTAISFEQVVAYTLDGDEASST